MQTKLPEQNTQAAFLFLGKGMAMQIVKYLQAQGFGSRKICTDLVKDERVQINDEWITNPKATIDLSSVQSIKIDEEDWAFVPLPYFYIVLNKPADYETSHKPTSYPSIFSLFPLHWRGIDLQAIGRLDADTTGMLLITNDGAYNHKVTSPKHHVGKVYQVTLKHPADDSLPAKLKAGVLLHDDNETVIATDAYLENDTTLIMTLHEGKYHQVKRMIAAAGNRVEQLHRRQFGEFTLQDDLAAGEWKFVIPTELMD